MKKILTIIAIAATLALPGIVCKNSNVDDHAGIAYDTDIGTIQIGDAMDLSCAADPTDPSCDAFNK